MSQRTISRDTVFEGRVFTVESDRVRLPHGPEAVMDSPVARERYRESLQQCADEIAAELGASPRR